MRLRSGIRCPTSERGPPPSRESRRGKGWESRARTGHRAWRMGEEAAPEVEVSGKPCRGPGEGEGAAKGGGPWAT